MDWELYDRYRSTLLLAALLLVSAVLFTFQKTPSVQHLRAFLVRFTLPPQRLLAEMKNASVAEQASPAAAPGGTAVPESDSASPYLGGEERRRLDVLLQENERLRTALDLKKGKWPRAIVAHVAGRDPQRWFQEVVLDKGKDDGIEVDSPVLVESGGREALLGRILEASARVSKVMLLQDSLSAVAATVAGDNGEDGVVEGTNEHDLLLKFLDRGSQVKIGDLVTTSGLGQAFPPGVAIGWVEDIEPDPRQLFLQAKLHPAAQSNRLRVVLVLEPKRGEQ